MIPEAFLGKIMSILETQLSSTFKRYARLPFHIQQTVRSLSLDLPGAAFQGISRRVPVFFA